MAAVESVKHFPRYDIFEVGQRFAKSLYKKLRQGTPPATKEINLK
jgi:hypothetical protein